MLVPMVIEFQFLIGKVQHDTSEESSDDTSEETFQFLIGKVQRFRCRSRIDFPDCNIIHSFNSL